VLFTMNCRKSVLTTLLLFGGAALSGFADAAHSQTVPAAGSTKPAPSSSPATGTIESRIGKFAGSLGEKDPAGKESATQKAADEKPITDAEAKAFAEAFNKALKAGNAKDFGEMFDDEAMIRKAVGRLELSPETAEGFVKGDTESARQGKGAGSQFSSEISKGGKFHLLCVRKQHKLQCALYRFIDNEDRLSYIEFALGRDAVGKVRIIDYYDYGFAELHTSALMREVVYSLVDEHSEAVKPSPDLADYAKHRGEIESMGRLIYDKKPSEAIAIYEKLPESVKKSRIGLILRVSACRKVKDQCDDLVDLFKEKFPHDPGLDLFMGQYHAAVRRWDEALEGIDRLDRQLGHDSYLDAERAQMQLLKGNLSLAKELLKKSVQAGTDAKIVGELQKRIAEIDKDLGGATPASEEPPGKPAGDSEAHAFVEQFVKCVMTGDAEGIKRSIDVGSFYRRATAKMEIPAEIRFGLEANFRSGYGANLAKLFEIEKDAIGKGAGVSLLRLRGTKGGERRALFRLVFASGAFEHCDCVLEQFADGKVRIADFYDLTYGGMRSEMYSLFMMALVENYKPSSDDDPQQPQPQPQQQAGEPRTLATAFREMHHRVIEGRYQEAVDLYGKLPGELQKDRHILLERVHAAAHVKGQVYDDAVRDYAKAFPDASNLDLIMFDVNMEQKLYVKALASLDGLDRKIGGDPFVDVLRCETYLGKEKPDINAAKRFAHKAVEADPHLFMAYKWLLKISLKQKKFTETSTLLTAVKKQCPLCMPEVKSDPEFQDYLRSTQYKVWAKKQGQKG
jgi:tetratricopeptide (TPR) repeat protein